MRLLRSLLALVVCAAMGGAVGTAMGVPPAAGAIGLSAVALASPLALSYMGDVGLRVGLYPEIWTGEQVKAFRQSVESIGWLNKIRAYDQYVVGGRDNSENDVIHFTVLGGDPGVLVNNTTYPIDVESLADADKPIQLDKYQTKVTVITDDELYALGYDKMGSVVERHRDAVNETKYAKALHALAPAGHTAATPVLLTSGALTADGLRKMVTRADIIALKKQFDVAKVPTTGRVLVLCPDHVGDLLDNDQKFAEQYYNYQTGKIANLYGFEVYEYSEAPRYVAHTKTKVAFGAAAPDSSAQASVAFYAPRMFKATGRTNVYLSEAKSDTETQQNKYNIRHYFICLPLKNEAIGAIVSDVLGEQQS